MAKQKVIQEQCYNSDQSWHYEKIVEIPDHKLKVAIRRNAYDNQSYARVERWNGGEWKFVCHKPITACVCSKISYVEKNKTASDFAVDAADLLKIAITIIE